MGRGNPIMKKKLNTAFNVVLIVLVTFTVTQLANNYRSWDTLPPLSDYVRIPNATEKSRAAADDYLQLILSPLDAHNDLKELHRISQEPVWAFSNSSADLYMREGLVGNKNAEFNVYDWM